MEGSGSHSSSSTHLNKSEGGFIVNDLLDNDFRDGGVTLGYTFDPDPNENWDGAIPLWTDRSGLGMNGGDVTGMGSGNAVAGPSDLPDMIQFSEGEVDEQSPDEESPVSCGSCGSAARLDNAYAHNQDNHIPHQAGSTTGDPAAPGNNPWLCSSPTLNPICWFAHTSTTYNNIPEFHQDFRKPTNIIYPINHFGKRPFRRNGKHFGPNRIKMVRRKSSFLPDSPQERKERII